MTHAEKSILSLGTLAGWICFCLLWAALSMPDNRYVLYYENYIKGHLTVYYPEGTPVVVKNNFVWSTPEEAAEGFYAIEVKPYKTKEEGK